MIGKLKDVSVLICILFCFLSLAFLFYQINIVLSYLSHSNSSAQINFLSHVQRTWVVFFFIFCCFLILTFFIIHYLWTDKQAKKEVFYQWVMDELGFCITGQTPDLANPILKNWIQNNISPSAQSGMTCCFLSPLFLEDQTYYQGYFFIQNGEYYCTAWKSHHVINKISSEYSRFILWDSLFLDHIYPMLHVVKTAQSFAIKNVNNTLLEWLSYTDRDFVKEYFSMICPNFLENNNTNIIDFIDSSGKKTSAWILDYINNDQSSSSFYDPFQEKNFFISLLPLQQEELEDYFSYYFVNKIPIPLIFLNKEGLIMHTNQRWLQFFNHDYSQTKFSLLNSLKSAQKKILQQILQTKEEGLFFLNNPIQKICVRSIPYPMGGELLKDYQAFYAYPLTSQMEQETKNQLINTQKLQTLGVLSSNISHDFNNILTSIIGFCDLLIEKMQEINDIFLEDIKEIKNNAFRASNVVRQLLFFSKQEEPMMTIFNASEVLDNAWNMARRLVTSKIYITLQKESDEHLDNYYIEGDSGQFHQIILNLIINSRDAILPNSGLITLSIKEEKITQNTVCINRTLSPGSYISVQVKDSGCGIPKEHIHNIFKPFFSTKSHDKGTGLGLSTCYQIIHDNEGGIQVETELNKGTTMTIFFPKKDRFNNDHTEKIHIDNEKNYSNLFCNKKILLVEDENAVRCIVSSILRRENIQVDEAANSPKAMDYIEKNIQHYDLIMLDIEIPGMISGIGLAESAFEKNKDVNILFISGHAKDIIPQHFSVYGDRVHFLSKPFSKEIIKDKIFHILNKNHKSD